MQGITSLKFWIRRRIRLLEKLARLLKSGEKLQKNNSSESSSNLQPTQDQFLLERCALSQFHAFALKIGSV